jgi:hypothetical protein
MHIDSWWVFVRATGVAFLPLLFAAVLCVLCAALRRCADRREPGPFLRLAVHAAEKVRMGSAHGGFVLALLPQGCEYDGFLSAGVGHDVDFECDVLDANAGLTCDVVDGTVRSLARHHPRLRFHGSSVDPETWDKHLRAGSNLLVKIDLERESQWLAPLTSAQLQHVAQLVLQVHNPRTRAQRARLRKLLLTHNVVHFHGNNCAGRRLVNNVWMPRVFQLTLLRKDLCEGGVCSPPIPDPKLDAPNDPRRTDIPSDALRLFV